MIDPQNPDYQNTPVSSLRPVYYYHLENVQLQPAVSIITPFYNTGAVFEETAKSILQQSLQQWEWIIVNDGSTDPDSLELLQKYRGLDPRVRVVDHPTNLGLPSARNSGARTAACQYLLFVDSDDLIEPTAAEKWLWYLDSHPNLSFAGGYSLGFGVHEYLWQSGFQDMEANLKQNRINHVVMVRKAVWEAVGGYDESFRHGLEDWDFWVRCANQGYWGNSIPEYLHWYRTRQDHTDRWGHLNDEYLANLQQEFSSRYPKLFGGGFPRLTSHWDLQLLHMREDRPAENHLKKNGRRLLFIAPWLTVGGAEKFNLDLMKQLIKRGWEITLVTTSPGRNAWQHEFEKLSPDVFPLHNFLEWADYPRFLRYLMKSRDYDAIFVTSSHEAYRLLPYLRFHFPNTPIVDYLHFVTPDWMNGGFPRLSLLFHSSIDLSIVTSQQLKNWMVDHGGNEQTVKVCTANVDTKRWQPDPEKRMKVRSKLGVADDHAIVLYIGRMEQQKQPRVFANTMLQLSQRGLSFTAVAIGEGSLKSWLDTFVQNFKMEDKLLLTGVITQDEVTDWMAAGDIIFLPSENEGIALTIYEGMASGLVPVGADVGGQRELVTPECGYLLPRSTEEDEALRYAEVLAELIQDPQKRQCMGKISRERVVEHFDLDQMGDRMEVLIRMAIKLRHENPGELSRAEIIHLEARQSVEYLRLMAHYQAKEADIDQLRLTMQEQSLKMEAEMERALNTMPPASAGTYFYFSLRQVFYPILRRVGGQGWLLKLTSVIKSALFRISG